MIQVGQVLDKYELLERVGQGGMAVVYRGLDRSLKRVVAIKILHKHLVRLPGGARPVRARGPGGREAAPREHPRDLRLLRARPGSESYIVTEFIDGQTLKQFITDRPIAFPEIGAMIVLQVGRALAHAHAAGILHRDVKPENIMIRSDGVVKLMDFGISHMVDLERLTVTGQLLGSPAYMAPEHVEGRPLDFRTDVFAVGIVLYQLAVGKLPFEGKNPHEVLKRIAECKFVDPRQANPRIGNRLGRIILRAMAAQPDDRYPGDRRDGASRSRRTSTRAGIATDKIAGELARYFAAPGAVRAGARGAADRSPHAARPGAARPRRPRRGARRVRSRAHDRSRQREGARRSSTASTGARGCGRSALGVLAACVIGGGAFLIHEKSTPAGPDEPPPPDHVGSVVTHHVVTAVAPDDRPPPAAPVVDAGPELVADAEPVRVAVGSGGSGGSGGRPAPPPTRARPR